jgi:DNA-binding transcriptional MerR regulator
LISVLAKQFGLTPRAIRYYEERGLIQTSRDRFNMRRFDAPTRDRLTLIAKLRRAGIGLPDIEEVLDEDGVDQQARQRRAIRKLDKRRATLLRALDDVEAVRADLLAGSAGRATPMRRVG